MTCNKIKSELIYEVNNSIGKPEALTGNLSGYWSVRIDEKNRMVFCIKGNILEIVECGSHYGDH